MFICAVILHCDLFAARSLIGKPDGRLKPRAELETLFAKIGREPVTTYCNSGHLAATDWFVLSEILGHPDVKLYDGSMSQWTADASRPVTN